MIDAKELRLGNWVKIRGEYNVQVVDLIGKEWFSYMKGQGCDYKDAEGIELTGELLIKCGFWKADGYNFDLGDLILHDMFDGKDNDCEAYLKAGIATIYIKNIKHLHELQNLYWCLTQKELEVNL